MKTAVVDIAAVAGNEVVVEQLPAVEIAVAEVQIDVVIWVIQRTAVEVALCHYSVGQESAGKVETFGQQLAEEHQMPVVVLLETKGVVIL